MEVLMPRKPRCASSTGVYHFVNRGVNKEKLFHRKGDYDFYCSLMQEYSEKLNIQIYHYCLMANHTHLLIQTANLEELSRFGYFIQRRYAYYYSKSYSWPEQVFRKRFFSLSVEKDSQLLECGRYIERNPVQAGITNSPTDYAYSSYQHYVGLRHDEFITYSPTYLDLSHLPAERQRLYQLYVCHERAVPLKQKEFLRV
jgi:putative transposase